MIPSSLALMVAVPVLTAVTLPDWSTKATELLLLLQVGSKPDDTFALIFLLSPGFNVNFLAESVITGFLTLTLHWTCVWSAFTVMVASPGFMAVIFPFSLTVATLFLLVLNVGLLPLDVLAVSLNVSPCSREIDFLLREMLVLETVMLQ